MEMGLSVLLVVVASWIAGDQALLVRHAQLMGWFVVFTAAVVLYIAPAYQSWHQYMRKQDDREISGIFHSEDYIISKIGRNWVCR